MAPLGSALSYRDIERKEMLANVGRIKIDGQVFTLCDHIQKHEDEYYATAYYDRPARNGRSPDGIFYKLMGNDPVALIPISALKKAYPAYQDGERTEAMILRLLNALEGLNVHVGLRPYLGRFEDYSSRAA